MPPSRARYLTSISQELVAQATRVRDLIGEVHWLTDGRHKESLLKELISRHVPASVMVTSGFVLAPNSDYRCSKEQDIFLLDVRAEGPIFNRGDVCMAFPETVIAAISVKSTMGKKELISVFEGLGSVRNVVQKAGVDSNRVWCGGFFYSRAPDYVSTERIVSLLEEVLKVNLLPPPRLPVSTFFKSAPDIICDSEEFAAVIDPVEMHAQAEPKVRCYACNGSASAVFLNALLEHVAWFMANKRPSFGDLMRDLPVELAATLPR
ncbi:MAG: DUF6602 domain-containing protein [Chthoniobacteraceae bacterium]